MEYLEEYWQRAVQGFIGYLPNLLSAFITLIVGYILIKLFRRMMMRFNERKRFDTTVLKFTMDVFIWVFRILLFVSIITKLGVETSAFVAIIGAAGLAIGLSLQGSLSNFAGGILIILFKPLRVGDYIEAQGEAGTVATISIFSTKIITPNNQSVYMPNGILSNGIIRNFSKEKLRRAEIVLSVNRNSDPGQVKEVIFDVIKNDKRILKNPAPMVLIKDLTNDALLLTVLIWSKTADHGWVVSDFYENIRYAFHAHQINIPASKREIVIERLDLPSEKSENEGTVPPKDPKASKK